MQFGVFESLGKAVEKSGQVIDLTVSMLKKLLVGDVGLNNLSGPISIAKGAGTTADYGFVYFLGFLALISINLGIINLVPLPMLDGGHLLFFMIEAVIRRPVPEKVQEMGYRIGGAIIFSLMAVAIFNDFTHL
ncbi:regulator of sigma E protease [Vibrio cholerae]|nr:regulator of sigma E protease [Vibrio cholerae]